MRPIGYAIWLCGAVAMCAAGENAAAQTSALSLHPMFQDHAVLQRDRPIAVYGDAPSGATVTVTLAGESARVTAARDGHWLARLPALPAGGPYTLEVQSGGTVRRAQDIQLGDVFLCTGQSNMQMAVRAAANAEEEIRDAHDGGIRQLTIGLHESLTPLSSFAAPVEWSVASPETAGRFSASCYFFARELRKTVHVPIGLVVSAWGGSRVRAWVSEDALRKLGYFNDDLDMLDLYRRDPPAAQRKWDAAWENWWQDHAKDRPWNPDFDANAWQTAPVMLGPWALWHGDSPDGFVGQMWLRTSVTLTKAQASQPAILDLGAVNEEDESWVNGRGVGGTSWSKAARHEIPPGVLRPGENVIVTNIFCSWRNCGMSGPAETRAIRFDDGTSVPLAGPWRYAQVPDLIAPQIPWGPTHGVSMDYNGMIAPIGPYAFRAAIWYQGESNIYFAGHYQATLTAMMADWRRLFGAGLPFLIVQIPGYGPIPIAPVESGWSDVREAQRRAAGADANAAYIVTVDIGDPKVLHPTNKQEIGRRLARAARHLVYGAPEPASGPKPASVSRNGGSASVSFVDVTGNLVSYSGDPNAFELCEQKTCRFVSARIEGSNRVVLAIPSGLNPSRIRYCWGDSPICTLSDQSGLPATPFEIALP
ncbi:MAG TPA: sialate O-acetylesterase [Rhizomicrobium sp.]|nr:sialate O-acetylesterase [Rhizomicrobium sp.]